MKCQILFLGKNKKNISKCCLLKILPNCCTIKGKDTRYKFYWSGNDKGTAGVGMFVAEEWIEKVFEVQRVSDNHLSETQSASMWLPFCLCMPHRLV